MAKKSKLSDFATEISKRRDITKTEISKQLNFKGTDQFFNSVRKGSMSFWKVEKMLKKNNASIHITFNEDE